MLEGYNYCTMQHSIAVIHQRGRKMAHFKPYSHAQGKFLPVHFAKQILPGTFEYCLNNLIDHKLDLSVFGSRFCNDETGATTYSQRILLNAVTYAYSWGIHSNRKIEQTCQGNIIFMALSADTRSHFTTIDGCKLPSNASKE